MPARAGHARVYAEGRAGTRIPAHEHAGLEWTCVLQGAFRHQLGQYGVRDFDEADDTVEHRSGNRGRPRVHLSRGIPRPNPVDGLARADDPAFRANLSQAYRSIDQPRHPVFEVEVPQLDVRYSLRRWSASEARCISTARRDRFCGHRVFLRWTLATGELKAGTGFLLALWRRKVMPSSFLTTGFIRKSLSPSS